MTQSTDYFERKLDEKHRLTIPTSIRAEFASGYVITYGFRDYLHLYPKHIWEETVESSLKEDKSILSEEVSDLNVRFRMGKSEGALDRKQGRVTLEKHQVDHARLGRDVLAVRAGQYWRLQAKSGVPPT